MVFTIKSNQTDNELKQNDKEQKLFEWKKLWLPCFYYNAKIYNNKKMKKKKKNSEFQENFLNLKTKSLSNDGNFFRK